ncbi:hypothetical protein NPIL_696091 [Nephila pilipes]|uniref:Mariner Mos1 transposase n=1 Tax=Nephila pilipes TaxID=299642 RepID=A0A8X6PT96_NEPPI|nr:hypothetical protein NPIL_696091 [Nephila pilipes]
MNAAKYIEILVHFMKRLHGVRPQYAQEGSWFFVHKNVRSHTANIFKQLVTKKGMVQIEHLPYKPDFNPPVFFQFPPFKLALKEKRFDNILDIQQN